MKILKLNKSGLKELEEWINEGMINVKIVNNNGKEIKWLHLKIDKVWEEGTFKVNESEDNLEQENNDKDIGVEKNRKRKIYNEKGRKGSKIRKKDNRDDVTEISNNNNKLEESDKLNEVNLLIRELDTPCIPRIMVTNVEIMEVEENDIEKLVLQYEKLEVGNRLLLKDWYEYGRSFIQNIESRKIGNNKGKKRRKSEQEIREELYNMMMEFQMNILDENNEIRKKVRDKLRKKTQKAIKVYELFMEIGNEKLERLREVSVTFVVELTGELRNKVIEYFRNKR